MKTKLIQEKPVKIYEVIDFAGVIEGCDLVEFLSGLPDEIVGVLIKGTRFMFYNKEQIQTFISGFNFAWELFTPDEDR